MASVSGGHIPVLGEELLIEVAPTSGQVVVDATVGGGGHSRLLLEPLGSQGRLIGLDQDRESLLAAEERLKPYAGRFSLHAERFSRLGAVLKEQGVSEVDVVVADLGISSVQLDEPNRGFSFLTDGPLDMRMDRSRKLTAEELVNGLPERELADLIFFKSQERLSRRIAKRICQVRRDGRIKTTGQLVRIVCDALGVKDPLRRRSKTHPATRTFQALRIAVNEETEELMSLLGQVPQYLKPGGRFAVISFHSVEDRAVKRDFLGRKREGVYEILTKKPITPSREERERNPRCRSAKLRVVRRADPGASGGRASAGPDPGPGR